MQTNPAPKFKVEEEVYLVCEGNEAVYNNEYKIVGMLEIRNGIIYNSETHWKDKHNHLEGFWYELDSNVLAGDSGTYAHENTLRKKYPSADKSFGEIMSSMREGVV